MIDATLLRTAARVLETRQDYGAVEGPEDLGRYVRLTRDLRSAADDLEQISDTLVELDLGQIGQGMALDRIEDLVGSATPAPPRSEADRADSPGAYCASRGPRAACLPTWIDAKLVCLHCRRPLPSPRDTGDWADRVG